MAADPLDPYAAYRPLNQAQFSPSPSSGAGGFSDWLSSLPSAQQLSPTSTYVTGRRGETGVGPNMAPAMWMQFAPHAANLINQAAQAKRGAATAGAANSRREFERALLSSYQSQGVDPSFARRQLAEQRPQVGYQLQQQLGGIEADRLGQTLGLQTGIQNALVQNYQGERQLSLEMFLASKARKAARSAGQNAMQMQGLGMLTSLIGQGLGGGAGGGYPPPPGGNAGAGATSYGG